MPRLIFHPAADAELIAAAEFYESQANGLGRDFLDETSHALSRIGDFPQAWPVMEADIRRCLLKRFPYAIFYRLTVEHIRILAIADLRREPGYWRERLTD
ncbi:MAG: type II toxin-antitoxin system RelE/ParE family toxin [Verrucomicrobia bacterium]|nr:type II toxin-antitoxin system RelE/ParE family toxin [Verrucomicrobiota bacterium]